MRQRRPGRLRPFFRIEGAFARSAFAPAFRAIFVNDAREYNSPLGRAAKARLEKMHETKTNLAQLYQLNSHHPSTKRFVPNIMPRVIFVCQLEQDKKRALTFQPGLFSLKASYEDYLTLKLTV
jgi:hypothetical protein